MNNYQLCEKNFRQNQVFNSGYVHLVIIISQLYFNTMYTLIFQLIIIAITYLKHNRFFFKV